MITDPKLQKEFFQALNRRDSEYVGVFFAGVTSTNIFCISTCRARKPKEENVKFFESAKEALQHGFRPCKVCRPTEHADAPPPEVRHLIQLVQENPESRISDRDVRELGYQPEKIRRWFRRHMDITFQSYQRMIRLNLAYEKLRKGEAITGTAYDSGFESLSGFGYSFKRIFEDMPSHADQLKLIKLYRFTTPLGPMYAGTSDNGLCLLEFTDRRMLETEFEDLSKRLGARITVDRTEIHRETEDQLNAYFKGKRKSFDLPLDMPGTPFQQSVWKELLKIPYGQTRSYLQQAKSLGNPQAIRAVARANGMNRIAIVVPCHRVIGSNGQLTGYAGGLARKKWLLDLENPQLSIS